MSVSPDSSSDDAYKDESPASGDDPRESRDSSSGEESAAPAAVEESGQDEVADLKAQVDENWDKYLRTAAELENVRKRAARDMENARKFALERFAADILAVRDSLEMGLAAAEQAGASGDLVEGNKATLKQLTSTLERFGVEEIDPLGDRFDPLLHEAMTMQPSRDAEPDTVLTVFQKGYTLNGRLLRPARVVVASAPDRQE